jgi:hypothetical protein
MNARFRSIVNGEKPLVLKPTRQRPCEWKGELDEASWLPSEKGWRADHG